MMSTPCAMATYLSKVRILHRSIRLNCFVFSSQLCLDIQDIADNLLKMKMKTKKRLEKIGVITKLPNSEQSYKGKVKTHMYINRQNQSTTGKL